LYKPAKRRFVDALTTRQFVRHNTRIAAPDLCPLREAFSSEVDTGSRKENASNESFQGHRNRGGLLFWRRHPKGI
jgi:hypothetical protein